MNPLNPHDPYTFIRYLPPSSIPPSHPPFEIKHSSTWTYSGPLLPLTPTSLPPSLHTWLSRTTTSPSALLSRLLPLLTFLSTLLPQAGYTHYWLTLRATTPTSEFDTPRWHVDDDLFFSAASRLSDPPSDCSQTRKKGKKSASKNKEQKWKLCTTLLGPPTLFLPPPSNPPALRALRTLRAQESASRAHVCSSLRCAGCFDTGAAVRARLAVRLAGENVVQGRDGEVAVFRTGGERGAVHSEPPCGEARVFVNVVPGREEELRAAMEGLGMGFPRAWCWGVVEVGEGMDGLGWG